MSWGGQTSAAAAIARSPLMSFGPRRWGGLAALGLLACFAGVSAFASVVMAGGSALAGAIALLLLACVAVASAWPERLEQAAPPAALDWSLLHAAFIDGLDATAITDRRGSLLCVSPAYEEAFGCATAPKAIALSAEDARRLAEGARRAWREGGATVTDLALADGVTTALLRRAGRRDDHLVWRFRRGPQSLSGVARALLEGEGGRRLGDAGVMAVLADPAGHLLAANDAFARRAAAAAPDTLVGRDLGELLHASESGLIGIVRERDRTAPLRTLAIPLADGAGDGPSMFLLLDETGEAASAAAFGTATVHLHGLLAILPLGVALIERDGRFLFMNDAFGRAAGLPKGGGAMYPSDLVVEDDKPTVIEAIRRFTSGRALPGDLAIRLAAKPDEPVALTIANATGLGDAAVLLSLRDDTEESKLKRQVAQANKMQAVGQLAGGVAHDFNNILTAIIGHCDLMLMRHTPGDIDYDDIQQIKHNSNRAASLTRQLLAFSRQQTLRPQILQLPDVISEVSNLLRRLLGETIRLEVKHGRNLGLVRADPGQLEQVIVNLAVNSRDAMPDGGTLTLQTLSVTSAEVRRMRSEILPVADYTALRVVDTGLGIPPDIIGNVFEPFFTTKEVGKGTGLGLSTVYGIVKQTDGFIFAESEVGKGTSFIIYLPVHHAAAAPEPVTPVRIEPPSETWGTGTILLVEDEAMVRTVAERALKRQGYTVLLAANGEEALELLAERGPVDLLISDVVMPMMDGPTLVRAARVAHPDLPILFMSGYAEEQLRQSLDIDHVAFLAKPFSVQQLAQAARDVLVEAESSRLTGAEAG